jgi:hypothetical protein
MTEIEEVKAEIEVLTKKLSFLEELEKTKSPVEEAYKDWMGQYPPTTPSVDGIDDIRWRAFQMGYNASKEKKVSESFQAGYEFAYAISTAKEVMEKVQEEQNVVDEPDYYDEVEWDEKDNPNENPLDWVKPQTPEQKEAFREAIKQAIEQGIILEVKQPTDELVDKLTKNPPSFLKFELGKTLEDICMRWWDDVFTTHSDWDCDTCIEDLVDQIEMWLPKSQSANSQNTYVELAVEGFNDAIKKIKSKLR